MGADLIGWRDCELQRPLGPEGFLQKLKMRAYLRVVEERVPPEQRDKVKIAVVVNDRERELGYAEIREQAETFQRGIPECARCPLSSGAQLGCYRYVTYPLDAVFEEVAFEFFAGLVATTDSIADQLYRDIVSRQPSEGSGWHVRRGPEGPLARRSQPLTHSWGGWFSKKKVDSAQLMASLFISLDDAAVAVAYARFWSELVAFADGKLESARQRGDAALAEGLVTGTFAEIRSFAGMMLVLGPMSLVERWRLVADG